MVYSMTLQNDRKNLFTKIMDCVLYSILFLVLETSPDWGDVYTDSTSITINWRKPDILAYLIKAGQLVNIWGRDQVELDKYMQCKYICHIFQS